MAHKLRWLVPLLALAAVAVAGPAAATAAPMAQLDGVRTTLWTDPATTKVLLANKIVPLPTRGTGIDVKWTSSGPSIGYRFPISGGHVDAATLAGRINHTGGLKFANLANGRTLTLTNFRSDRRASAPDGHRQRRPESARPHPAPQPVQGHGRKATALRQGRPRRRLPQLNSHRRLQQCPRRLILRARHQARHGTRARARRRITHPSAGVCGRDRPQTPARSRFCRHPPVQRGDDVTATSPAPTGISPVTWLRPAVDIAAAESAARTCSMPWARTSPASHSQTPPGEWRACTYREAAL
jgi:hypothetical protein